MISCPRSGKPDQVFFFLNLISGYDIFVFLIINIRHGFVSTSSVNIIKDNDLDITQKSNYGI